MGSAGTTGPSFPRGLREEQHVKGTVSHCRGTEEARECEQGWDSRGQPVQGGCIQTREKPSEPKQDGKRCCKEREWRHWATP